MVRLIVEYLSITWRIEFRTRICQVIFSLMIRTIIIVFKKMNKKKKKKERKRRKSQWMEYCEKWSKVWSFIQYNCEWLFNWQLSSTRFYHIWIDHFQVLTPIHARAMSMKTWSFHQPVASHCRNLLLFFFFTFYVTDSFVSFFPLLLTTWTKLLAPAKENSLV